MYMIYKWLWAREVFQRMIQVRFIDVGGLKGYGTVNLMC
jgi:hypothetical protein